MDSLELCLDGGNVLRYHTYAHTHRQQTVAEHSFRAYHVAMYITKGSLELEVAHEILHHDIAEAYTGDVPFPVKADNANLRGTLKSLEDDLRETHELMWDLTPGQIRFVKLCDMLEMGTYAVEQIDCGNKRYEAVAYNVLQWLQKVQNETGIMAVYPLAWNIFHRIRVRVRK